MRPPGSVGSRLGSGSHCRGITGAIVDSTSTSMFGVGFPLSDPTSVGTNDE